MIKIELRTKEGMYIISKEDYEIIHDIKHRWQELHGKWFKTGKLIAELSVLFNKLDKVPETPQKTENTPIS